LWLLVVVGVVLVLAAHTEAVEVVLVVSAQELLLPLPLERNIRLLLVVAVRLEVVELIRLLSVAHLHRHLHHQE
jgi:hypothetical protein